jgi:predicted TIM-barrel fold metal-dependent hydrolase
MTIDCHVHCWGEEKGEDLLRSLDRAGFEAALLLSPPESESAERQREKLAAFARVTAHDPARLLGFAWIEPTLPGAADQVRRAAGEYGFAGIKLMPNHWYPYEERLFPFYEAIEASGLPVLWHSGILWNFRDGSRFCRPAYYEVMLRFPGIRFALAHIGWPWVDECLAVAARVTHGARLETGRAMEMFVDLSPGTPPSERKNALRKALEQLGPDRLLWGSDDLHPLELEKAARLRREDEAMLRELGLDDAGVAKVFGENHLRFLGRPAGGAGANP